MTTHYDPYPRQAAAPVARAYAPSRSRLDYYAPAEPPSAPEPRGIRVDGLALAALVVVAFLIAQSLLDRNKAGSEVVAIESPNQAAENLELTPEGASTTKESEQPLAPPAPAPAPDPFAISYPYDEYWITQGVHGYSYGHMAIDLAAGKGTPIKSPINGEITGNYVDVYGNTTLIIENDVFRITLLHGNYSVVVGQKVALGDVVGAEGNNGYTTDMQGNSCRGRDCGYHSHLNVYNKQVQSNVNPLQVLQ